MSHVKTAVFPVAGLGTRLLPATKTVPKELVTLIDRPLIQYAVDEARAAGIESFIFVSAAGKGALEDYFDTAAELERHLADRGKTQALAKLADTRLPEGALTVLRQDRPRGLGHAVRVARRHVGTAPFAVILPDDVIRAPVPALAQMIAAHAETGGHMVATMEVPRAQTGNYGILDVSGGQGRLARARGLVEKPDPERAPSQLAIVGRYILQPSVFDRLGDLGPGAGGEMQLTDAINADAATVPVHGFRFSGERFDCGTAEGHVRATLALALERPDLRDAVAGLAIPRDLAA